MLDLADLEINVLEFRQRAFSFERVATLGGEEFAVFGRTETESESQFRPRLVHLKLAVPRAWVVFDATSDVLALARDGATVPVRLTETVIEVGAEPPTFKEQGIEWRRGPGPNGVLVYAPAERAERVLADAGLAELGVS
ncbi:MAG TPA: hypothetical protein VMG99_00445 [Thermoplasmata archaeon]|nr:hypothetical protein [Thermoplasmata archaeon]